MMTMIMMMTMMMMMVVMCRCDRYVHALSVKDHMLWTALQVSALQLLNTSTTISTTTIAAAVAAESNY